MIETNIEKSNVLHLSSESSRKLADISPSGILHLNRKMHITYKNPALKRMMNETDEDSLQFIGKSIFDLTSIKAAGLIDLFNRIANAEIITDYQTEFTSIYEKTVYISIHSIPLFDSLGAFDGAIITVSDKTNEKNVRQALEESENKLKSIFNSTDEAFFIFDFETNSIEEVNEAFYRLYEYSKEDLELISIDDLCAIEEGYDAKKAEHLTDKLSFKESVEFEWKAKSKTGKLLNVEVSVKKIEICHKVKALAIVRDISEKKKIQTDLIESQAKYKALFELTGDAILILKDSRIVDCNDTSLSLFNCAKEHILGKTPMDLSPEYQEDGTKTQEIGDKLIELAMNHKSQRFEWLHKDFNDNLFFVDITLNKFFINNNCYLLAMLRDISERKIYQEKLLYENRLMDSMLNSLPAMFFMYSQDGKLKKWNKNKEIFTGFSKDELKDKSILDWFEGYALEQVVEGLPGLFETTEIQTNILNTKIKDGSIVPYLYTTSTFEGNNQKYLIGTGIDVSEWKYIEDAYIESEEKYKNLIENANIGILIIEEGIVKLANPFMEEIIGYTPSEVLNRDFFDYIHEEDNEKLRKKFEELKIQKNITNPENIVFRIYSRNNNIKWIESRSVQIFWAGKDSILCFLTNISKRVETEEKIKDSENSLRTYLDTLPDPAFLIDTEMKIIVCNQSLADLYDEYLPNLIGKDVLSYLDEPLRSIRYGYIQACINSKNPIQIEDEREGIFSVTHYYPVKDKFGKVTRVAIISNDITERKLIEKQLETSEERYRNLFENANEAIVVIKNNRIVLYNKKSTDIIMGRLPQFLDNEFSKFIHPDDKDFIIETHNQILLGSKNDKKYRFRVILDEYLFVWLEASTVLINFEGEPATLSFINDITKQIEAENMIHIQNMAMESAVFAICLADLKGNITYYNKAFLELWELDENTEIIGKQFLDCMFINNYKHILEKLRINGYSIGEEKAVLNNNSRNALL